MKAFIQTLKQLQLMNRRSTLIYAVVSLIAGIVIAYFVRVDVNGEKYDQAGAFMSMLIGILLIFLKEFISITDEFYLAISMGKTRKCFVLAKYFLLVMNIAVVLVISLGIGFLETALYRAHYPNAICELAVTGVLTNPYVLVCVIFGVAMIVLLLGVFQLKYKAKFYLLFWFLCMMFSMGIRGLRSAMHEAQDVIWVKLITGIFNFFANARMWQIMLMVLGVTVAGVVTSFALLRKQRVTT